MKKSLYPHLQDPEWQKQRQNNWDRVLYRGMHEQPKYTWQYIQKYYFDGDVKGFNKREIASFKKQGMRAENLSPSIKHSLIYSPCISLEQFICILRNVFDWYDDNKQNISQERFEREKKYLLRVLGHFSRSIGIGFDVKLTDEIFFWIYGGHYDPERVFPISLGKDEWQPKLSGYEEVCANILRGLSNYLFVESFDEDTDEFEVVKYKNEKYSKYLITLLPHMDVEFFSKKIFEHDYINERGIEISPNQLAYREFFMGLLGFNIKEYSKRDHYYCRDKQMSNSLKRKIFSLDMPSEFNEFIEFIEFIEKHGDDSYRCSEE